MSRRGKNEGSIYKRRDGRWTATITTGREAGRRRRHSFYGKTRAEVAAKLATALRNQQSRLRFPDERLTVTAFLTYWLKESAAQTLRPRTLVSYRLIVEKHLTPILGMHRLVKLAPEHIQTYINCKLMAGLSPRTCQYHHAVLRRALSQAERWGKVERNVARLVSPPRVNRPEVRPLTPEQARKLLTSISEDRYAPLYVAAIALGLRQGELLGLSWDDVDLEGESLSVRRTLQHYDGAYHLDAPKTAKSTRTLGLTPYLVQLLRAHRQQQLEERRLLGPIWKGEEWNLVFCTEDGNPLSGITLTRRFQRLLKRLDLPRQRFHDLRHAAASFMLAQGVDLRTVMEVLGHSQIHTTANTYAHVRLEATRAAVERVDALLRR
jgi:integrase